MRERSGRLRFDRVTLAHRATAAVLIEDLTLSIDPGEVVTVMGPSGSGKSTLLAFAGGFLDRAAFRSTGTLTLGHDRLDDRPAEDRRLGVLFQDALLFPHLSVGGNLLFGLPRHRDGKRYDRRDAMRQALSDAGLAGFADRDPATLSGGQRARVALLRTLLAAPRALLLDEPFGKLDVTLRGEIRSFVLAEARARLLPVLLVTHDPADAAAAEGRVLLLERCRTRVVSAEGDMS